MHTMRLLSVISLLPLTAFAFDPRPMDYASDNDLHVFVSRPDLRPPKFSIQVLDKKHVSSGYWFVAPYGDLLDRPPMRSYRPGQVGPLIYDGAGNLVWSGAHLFGGRTTFDFKTASCNDSTCLTFILKKDRWFPRNPRGGGVILDNTFTVKDIVPQTAGQGNMNMHEFTLTDEGTALMVSYKPVYTDVTSHWDPAHEDQEDVSAWVGDNGFQEVDLVTKKPMFEWWALDTVHPSESYVVRPDFRGVAKGAWDFFHLNSIDKNSDGDYLISARFVNSIYKISATDGSVLWQLGGRRSTFKLQGFIFSSQHDARFRHENKTHTVISFFNNAADDHIFTANVSSAMIVSLDHTTQTASLIDKWDRPDHHLTHLRGNVQLLPNGNNFVCWSENGRISEFDPTGKLLLDAHFSSHRFVTYRAFKLNLTAVPAEQPALKAYVYGAHPEESTTAIYASWNGATEAVAWRFYGTQKQGRKPAFLEEVGKTGFETTFMVTGAMCQVYAEAMAANGTVLSHSAYEQTVLPAGWEPGLCELPRSGEGKQDASTPPQAAESHHVQGPSFLQVSCEPGSFDVMRLALSCLLVAVSFLLGMSAWKIQRLKKLIRMQEGLAYVPVDKT